jgi:restriction system protein
MISTIALIAGLIIGIALGRQILFRKSIGEALVANTIAAHFKQPHTLLNNVTLPTDTGTTQIDHVLVADTGIFVIETKYFSGWIYGGPNQSHWTQVIYKVKNKFQNPIRQNYGHLKTIQSLFTLPDDNFVSLVVFSGNAEFKSDLGPNVIQLNQLIAQLTVGRPVLFDERKMAYIIGRIEMKRLQRSLETDEYHLNNIRSKIRQRLP